MSDPVDEGGTDVATECAVEVRMNVMRLGVLEVELTPPSQGTPGPTTDGFSVRLRPVVDAYVVVTARSFRGNEVLLTLTNGGLKGRTNAAGHVIGALDRDWHDAAPAIEVTEQDDRIRSWSAEPPVCDEFVWPVEIWLDRELSLFWTYDPEVFETVLRELWLPGNPGVLAGDDDPPEPTDAERATSHARALERWGFIHLFATERAPAPPLQIPTLSATENMTIAELLLQGDQTGYVPAPPFTEEEYRNHAINAGHGFDEDLSPPYFHDLYRSSGVIYDVTPPALRALYLAEWAERCAVHLRKSTAADWAVLHRARELVDAFREGTIIHERQQTLLQSFLVSPNPGMNSVVGQPRPSTTIPTVPVEQEHVLAEAFRRYAWECAREGVNVDLVARSLQVSPDLRDWQAAAARVRLEHTVIHPLHGSPSSEHITLTSDTQKALREYFALYDFGRRLHTDGFHTRFDAHVGGINKALKWITSRAKTVLDRASIPAFSRAIGAQTPVDEELRTAYFERYWEAAAACRYEFWQHEIAFEEWQALVPVIKWAGSAASRTASVWKKFFETHLKRFEYTLNQVGSVNLLLNLAYRWDRAAQGVALVRDDHWTIAQGLLEPGTHFRVDFDQQTVTVHELGTTTTSVPLRFRVVLEVDPDARMFRGGNWRGRRSYVRVEVPVAADELQHNPHFPAWLKASANALNAVFVVQKLRDAEQELDATLCVEVAQGMLGVVESFNSVYHAIRVSRSIATNAATARVETLGVVVRRAATVNTLLGIGMDTYAGYKVLMGHDEGAMNALRAGEAGRWMLYEVKGVLKLGSAAGATAGLAATAAAELGLVSSAAATAFVSGPVGWGLIVLGVTVLVLDLAIVYEESQQGPLHTFEQAVNNAMSREFQEDVGLEALAPGADRPRAGQECLTKVYLATLHDRLGRV